MTRTLWFLILLLLPRLAAATPQPVQVGPLTVVGMLHGEADKVLLRSNGVLMVLLVKEGRVELRQDETQQRYSAVSFDNKLTVRAEVDGSLRWRRVSDGRDLLYGVVSPGCEWLVYTPSGYYKGSLRGASLAAWDFSLPDRQGPQRFLLAEMDERFRQRRLIGEILDRAQDERELGPLPLPLADGESPLHYVRPVLRLTSHTPNESLNAQDVQVVVEAYSPIGDPVSVEAHVPQTQRASLESEASRQRQRVLPLRVPRANFSLVLEATARGPDGRPAAQTTVVTPLLWGGTRDLEPPGPVYIVAAGVSRYVNQPSLAYAAKDAEGIVAAFREQIGKRYSRVEVIDGEPESSPSAKPLLDERATRSQILSALEALTAKKLGKDDLVVVFLAGHGLNDDSGFSFIPHEEKVPTPTVKPGVQAATSVDSTGPPGAAVAPQVRYLSAQDLQMALARIPARTVLIMDTCFSGGVMQGGAYTALLEKVRAQTGDKQRGVVVLASSTPGQTSGEGSGLQNGFFTHAVLAGLRGKADQHGNGQISVADLMSYVSKDVAERTSHVQQPTLSIPSSLIDFDLAYVRPACYRRKSCWLTLSIAGAFGLGALIGGLVAGLPLDYQRGNSGWLVKLP